MTVSASSYSPQVEGRDSVDLHCEVSSNPPSTVTWTKDGLEEVVASSWDGQTYIIRFAEIVYMVSLLTINTSQDRQAVRFQFEENVATFVSGMFSLSPGVTKPALVYVTFNNKIQVNYMI